MNAMRIAALGLGATLLAACGSRVEGTYEGVRDQSFLESITLKSDGKANVRFMGMTRQGTWELDERELVVTVGNDVQVLTLDDEGCLVGGGFLGTYCKDGTAPDDEAPREEKLAGAYEAGQGADVIRLEFEEDGVVRVSMRENGWTAETEQGRYEVDGERVRIAVAGGPGLELVRSGDILEGNVGYATLRFQKR